MFYSPPIPWPYYLLGFVIVFIFARVMINWGKPRMGIGQWLRLFIDPTYHLLLIGYSLIFFFPIVEFLIFRWKIPVVCTAFSVLCYAGASALGFSANRALGKQYTPFVDRGAAAQTLITTGIYKYVRHPIYAAGFLICLAHPAWFACRFSWVFLIIAWPAILVRMWREERLLLKNMEGYREYANKTKRIILGVF